MDDRSRADARGRARGGARRARRGRDPDRGRAVRAPTARCSGAGTTAASRTTTRPCTARPTRSATPGRRRSYRDTVMVTTLSPCWYCSGLVRQFGIGAVVIGESRTFQGGARLAARARRRGRSTSTPTSATSCCRASSPSTPRSGTRTSANRANERARSAYHPASRSSRGRRPYRCACRTRVVQHHRRARCSERRIRLRRAPPRRTIRSPVRNLVFEQHVDRAGRSRPTCCSSTRGG